MAPSGEVAPDVARVRGAARLRGDLRLPGDKSISHRALMLAALADGREPDRGRRRRRRRSIDGRHRGRPRGIRRAGRHRRPNRHLPGRVARGGRPHRSRRHPDCGNSGTSLRLISGILAGLPMTAILDGDASLRRRPVARIIEPLRSMGAVLHARRNDSLPPLTVVGHTPLRAIDIATPVPSAQVKSAILLAGLRADGRTTVREAVATRDHTERMLRARGVAVEREDSPDGSGRLDGARRGGGAGGRGAGPGRRLGGCLLAGGRGHPPRRRADPARRRGQPDPPRGDRHPPVDGRADRGAVAGREPTTASASRSPTWSSARPSSAPSTSGRPTWPPRSTRSRSCAWRRPPPAAPPSSAAPASCATRSRTGSAASPRACERWAHGSRSTATTSGSKAAPPLRGAPTDSLDDHRLAMTFAIAGLVASGETTIARPGSAAVSYPGFFDDLERVRA